jgi:hypothetical protein
MCKLILSLLLLGAAAYGQVTARYLVSEQNKREKIVEQGPSLVPLAATDIASTTTWVYMVTLTNESAGAVTCSIVDKQTTPRALVGPSLSIAANTTYVISFPEGRKMPSGITWSCSSGTVVTGYVTGRQLL